MMAEDQRLPVFELHIRPMLRLLDREHMITLVEPGFDLWQLESVWEMRNDILARVRGEGGQNMPGLAVGGPWPAEWIELFERWTRNPTADDIGHHLVLAQPEGPYQLLPASGDKRRLRAKVVAPSAGCRAWFELDSITPGRREYTIYLEPALPEQPHDETPLQALELFEKGDATRLLIRDAAGTHELTIP
jgi:hypothetical protein